MASSEQEIKSFNLLLADNKNPMKLGMNQLEHLFQYTLYDVFCDIYTHHHYISNQKSKPFYNLEVMPFSYNSTIKIYDDSLSLTIMKKGVEICKFSVSDRTGDSYRLGFELLVKVHGFQAFVVGYSGSIFSGKLNAVIKHVEFNERKDIYITGQADSFYYSEKKPIDRVMKQIGLKKSSNEGYPEIKEFVLFSSDTEKSSDTTPTQYLKYNLSDNTVDIKNMPIKELLQLGFGINIISKIQDKPTVSKTKLKS